VRADANRYFRTMTTGHCSRGSAMGRNATESCTAFHHILSAPEILDYGGWLYLGRNKLRNVQIAILIWLGERKGTGSSIPCWCSFSIWTAVRN
jgi:hypothetical protein